MPEDKIRLDAALLTRGLTPSRAKAKALILAGSVEVNGQLEGKSGRPVRPEDTITLRCANILPFVSRGGAKLQKAVEEFALCLEGCVCMDVGASTGGFTDCMLQQGAAKVYAIDVGTGQLAPKLRADDRVVCLERTNFRAVTRAQVPEAIAFASVDVSFISLRLIFPVLFSLLDAAGQAVCLIKPQFEAGRERVGKKGVVRDPAVQAEVIENTIAAAQQAGFFPCGLSFSPIKGPEGNIEFLLWLSKCSRGECALPAPREIVQRAVRALDETRQPLP